MYHINYKKIKKLSKNKIYKLLSDFNEYSNI